MQQQVVVPLPVQEYFESDGILTDLKALDEKRQTAICNILHNWEHSTAGQDDNAKADNEKADNADAATPAADLPVEEKMIALLALGRLSRSTLETPNMPYITKMPYKDFKNKIENLRISNIRRTALLATAICENSASPQVFVYNLTVYRRTVKCIQILEYAFKHEPVGAKQLLDDFRAIDRIFDTVADQYSAEHKWNEAAKFCDSNPSVSSLPNLAESGDDVIIDWMVNIFLGGYQPVFALPGDETLPEYQQRLSAEVRIWKAFLWTVKYSIALCELEKSDYAVRARKEEIFKRVWLKMLRTILSNKPS
eukprot:GHVQ01031794.1.p1 GENE.GHVQ01031794.1~~GHVQ01031794.1.p1  ORF type:complete len:358 (-),score=30.26 GHVQ01031794.1:397-1323(-)